MILTAYKEVEQIRHLYSTKDANVPPQYIPVKQYCHTIIEYGLQWSCSVVLLISCGGPTGVAESV